MASEVQVQIIFSELGLEQRLNRFFPSFFHTQLAEMKGIKLVTGAIKL